jgi:hypothetical protein
MTSDPTPEPVRDVVQRDPELRRLVRDLRPEPPDQVRLFRGRLVDSDASCVLKVGVDEMEAAWMPAMSSRSTDIVAGVIGHGILAATDRRWLLLVDLPHRARSDRPADVIGVMRCTARFQQVAAELSLPTYPIDSQFIATYSRQAIDAGCPGPASDILARIDGDEEWLRSLNGHITGHGDVHFWNAVAGTPDGPWRLIDPIPRTAHWSWDGAYAQLTSGVPETPDLITILASERRRLGLPVNGEDELDRVRTMVLGWSSLLWWAILPARRSDPWWRDQVELHVADLAALSR